MMICPLGREREREGKKKKKEKEKETDGLRRYQAEGEVL